MKKIISILLVQFCFVNLFFAAPINSNNGYKELSWGSSVEDAKKAGYGLTKLTANSDKEYLSKLYNVTVDGYKVDSKDKNVKALQFHFFQNKLFAVTEMLNSTDFTPQKLESRYGSFSQQGIFLVGKQYMDAKIEDGGTVSYLSIMISNSAGNISTIMYDWNVYKKISYVGQKLAKKQQKTIAESLVPLANNLIPENYYKVKPSFAITAFTTDYKNTLVDNYVTDALTEALFNTGKIKIIERANLETILKEQKFQASGLVNEATAKSIGMIAGVDFVCYGTLKDLGEEITVNARVVDVETGEVCAISRATIKKDDYLTDQPQGPLGAVSSSVKTTTNKANYTQQKPITTPSINNAWKVVKYRDDFDGYTQYIFRVFSTDHRFVFISYKKCDVAANSRVIAGIHWGECYDYQNSSYVTGTYDIKSDEGTISINYRDAWMHNLDTAGKEKFKFVWNQKDGSRLLTERFIKNETVSFRRDNLVRKFQTAGLLDKMAEYGVTWEEIDAAIASEEF